ncbi:MAG: NAD(P)H-hydrate dehydratase [Spongiibacteraceae bacterium]
MNENLPVNLYRAAQVRELDRVAIEEAGIAGFELMQTAAKAALQYLLVVYPSPEKITVFCGTGNNGGDGYVMAALAMQAGIDVEVIECGETGKIQGDALLARQLAVVEGVCFSGFDAQRVFSQGVIVDALLGTGLSGVVRGEFMQAIQSINRSACPVLAVDIPSGLCSDSGCVLGDGVYAEHTVSFIGLKQGLLTGAGPDYTGSIHYADLSVPLWVFERVMASSERLDLAALKLALPARKRSAHKGRFGHVMVTGGDLGMAGAALMASQAACRVGAGLTSCLTRTEHIAALVSRCPEVMAHGVVSGQEAGLKMAAASVVVIGPGLGRSAWSEQLLQQALQLTQPLVVDADALNMIAAGRVVKNPYRDNWILTPHPGEAARLLDCSVADIERDRFAAVTALQARYGGAVILKGAGTLVADAENDLVGLCPYGNPGMATGGMGDVLSGVLGALLAQGLGVATAARLGVCLHACAGDLAAQQDGQRGLLATDLIAYLRRLVN